MDDRYTETFKTWNKGAAMYQERFMDLDLYNDTYDFFCDAITKDKAKILEIGCGPGNITRYMLSRRPDWDILGIDIAPNMIKIAIKNNSGAHFDIMDYRHMDKLASKYDRIIGGFCLPYLSHEDSRKLIADCYHLLNENGLLYLSFVEGDPRQSGFQTASSGDRTYFYLYDTGDLTELLHTNNFGNINAVQVEYRKSEKETDTHTILTAIKPKFCIRT